MARKNLTTSTTTKISPESINDRSMTFIDRFYHHAHRPAPISSISSSFRQSRILVPQFYRYDHRNLQYQPASSDRGYTSEQQSRGSVFPISTISVPQSSAAQRMGPNESTDELSSIPIESIRFSERRSKRRECSDVVYRRSE